MIAPINKHLRLQGRQHALGIVEALGERLYTPQGVADAIAKLEATSKNKPESQVLGINDILEILRRAQPALDADKSVVTEALIND